MPKCDIERCIIEHCSPTLAGLKPAGLFSCPIFSQPEMPERIRELNAELNKKGIVISVMSKRDGRALIYVYRQERLKAELERDEVKSFLKEYGYDGLSVQRSVARLKERLAEDDFPHEIGIFLGYPLGDVVGFIENRGLNCKCVGCWKVYCNEQEAVRTFERYKKCTGIYRRLYENGRTVLQLTVAV